MPRLNIPRGTLLSALFVVMAGLGAGCLGPSGPVRVEVYGTITMDGEVIPEGTISFIPDAATVGPTAGANIAKGDFEIKQNGPAIGKYRVEIKAVRKTGKKIPAGTPAPAGTMIDEIEQYIPEKYNTKSELEIEFQSGRNEASFDLTSK